MREKESGACKINAILQAQSHRIELTSDMGAGTGLEPVLSCLQPAWYEPSVLRTISVTIGYARLSNHGVVDDPLTIIACGTRATYDACPPVSPRGDQFPRVSIFVRS